MRRVEFVKSAVNKEDYPRGRSAEVAILGRSNSGKSTFINSVAGDRVAKVSQQPGKTRTLNFFLVNGAYYFVDFPGYGYASRAHEEVSGWEQMVEGYLIHRKNLVGAVLLTDIRRGMESEENMVASLCAVRGLPLALILNKADKVSAQEGRNFVRSAESSVGVEKVFAASASIGEGVAEIEDYIFRKWVKTHPSS